MRPETAVEVRGIRVLQKARFQARLARLPVAPSDVWDHGCEEALLMRCIAQLDAGEDVFLQAWELADELVSVAGLRSRWDQSGPKCFRITGEELVPEDYERLPNRDGGQ